MSQAASQAHAFYREVAKSALLWTIRDEGGFPAPPGTDGIRAQPFWSSQARAERIIATVPAYAAFQVVEISWLDFRERWVAGLRRDGILVGINWSGECATGYDIAPSDVCRNVESALPSFADVESLVDEVDRLPPGSSLLELWVPDLLALRGQPVPRDVAMAIVMDRLLSVGLFPDGFIEGVGGRTYRYKRDEPGSSL